MLLKKIILNDLLRFSSRGSDNAEVASEEAIRLMIHTYQRENKLVNPMLILSTDVMNFLCQKSKDKTTIHYQLIVESGSRNGLHPGDKAHDHYHASSSQNRLHQGDHGSVHYTAMDVYCENTGKVTVLFADHHHGKHYNGFPFPKEQPNFPVHFIAVGNSLHQTDASHCPIFTLQHLLLTAHDDELRDRLLNMPQSKNAIPTTLRWFDLPPRYNFNTQSTSTLDSYIKHIENKETKTSGIMDSDTVYQCLTDAQFFKSVSDNFEWCDSKQKVINAGIQHMTIQFAHDVFSSIHLVTEEDLVKICYSDRYPIIADILLKTISLNNSLETNTATSGHPLFDFIFSNQAVLKLLSTKAILTPLNAQLHKLLTTDCFLIGIKLGFIDLNALSSKIFTIDSGQIKLNKSNLALIINNLSMLSALIKQWENKKLTQIAPEKIMDLLLFKNGPTVFKIEPIKQLYFSDDITIAQLASIDITKLQELTLTNLNKNEIKAALDQIDYSNPESPVSVARNSTSPAFHKLKNKYQGQQKQNVLQTISESPNTELEDLPKFTNK